MQIDINKLLKIMKLSGKWMELVNKILYVRLSDVFAYLWMLAVKSLSSRVQSIYLKKLGVE